MKTRPLEIRHIQPKIVAAMRGQGWTVKKLDNRYGEIPDLICAQGRRTVHVELKVVDTGPPWTMRQSHLRIGQKKWLTTWPGESYLVSFEWPNDTYWVVKGSPLLDDWTYFHTPQDVATGIEFGLAGFRQLPIGDIAKTSALV